MRFLEAEAVEEAGVELSASEHRVVHDLFVEGDGGFDAYDNELVERSRHAGDGLFPIVRRHDELADHRIVVRWHDVACVAMRINPDAGTTRRVEHLDFAW